MKNKRLYDKLLTVTPEAEHDPKPMLLDELCENQTPETMPVFAEKVLDELLKDCESFRSRVKENGEMKAKLRELGTEEIRNYARKLIPLLKLIEKGEERSSRHVSFHAGLNSRRVLLYHSVHEPFSDEQVDTVLKELSLVSLNNLLIKC